LHYSSLRRFLFHCGSNQEKPALKPSPTPKDTPTHWRNSDATVGRDLQPPKEVDLNTVLQDVIDMLDTELKEHNVDLEIDKDLPSVRGHQTDITTLMLNLIQNAIRHHPGPHPTIWVRKLDADTGMHLPFGRDSVVILVEDDGHGIPEEQKKSIFHPFIRGASAGGTGQGIGLSVAQRVMDHLEGRIWIEKREPTGARFCMAFPLTSETPPISKAP
jgi:protein-histidine pros-kinase